MDLFYRRPLKSIKSSRVWALLLRSALLPVASLLKTQCKCGYHPGAFKAESQVSVLVKVILLCILLIL